MFRASWLQKGRVEFMRDTFSANSLKILDFDVNEFKRYDEGLELIKVSEETNEGNRFHGLICYFLKGFETEKFENSLNSFEKEVWERVKSGEVFEFIKNSRKKFVEQPFFIKEDLEGKPFYLTGRFDLVVENDGKYTIFDWKTKNLPKNPEDDIQTRVYLEAAKKLFNTENIEMIYYSLIDGISVKIDFKEGNLNRIKKIVSKIY